MNLQNFGGLFLRLGGEIAPSSNYCAVPGEHKAQRRENN